MEKQEIHPIPFVTHSQAFLTSDEGEIVSEFKQELLQAVDQSIFERAFRVFTFQSKKLQDHGVLDFFFCRQSVLWQGTLPFPHPSSSVPRERCAFAELCRNLSVELPDGPAPTQCLYFIESPGFLALHRKQPNVMRPGERKLRR